MNQNKEESLKNHQKLHKQMKELKTTKKNLENTLLGYSARLGLKPDPYFTKLSWDQSPVQQLLLRSYLTFEALSQYSLKFQSWEKSKQEQLAKVVREYSRISQEIQQLTQEIETNG